MRVRHSICAAVAALSLATVSLSASAQSWDMPTAYAPANFHTVNIEKFQPIFTPSILRSLPAVSKRRLAAS